MPRYFVRVVSIIDRDNPVEAVDLYKEQLRNSDLDDLVYRAENSETDEMEYVHRGVVYSREDLIRGLKETQELRKRTEAMRDSAQEDAGEARDAQR